MLVFQPEASPLEILLRERAGNDIPAWPIWFSSSISSSIVYDVQRKSLENRECSNYPDSPLKEMLSLPELSVILLNCARTINARTTIQEHPHPYDIHPKVLGTK